MSTEAKTTEERLVWLQEAIADEIPCDVDEVTPEATLDSLGADSLDLFELALTIEEEFEIEIPEDKMAELVTVQQWANHIEYLLTGTKR